MPPTICLLIQNAKVGKELNSNQIWPGHLYFGSKLLAKFHEPNSSGSLDILLIRFSLALVWKGALLHHEDFNRKEKPNWQWAITQEVSGSIYSNVNQVIYFSLTFYSLGFTTLASKVVEILCWQDFIHIFSKGHNSGKAYNLDKKKSTCQLFFPEESIYEISKP